MDEMHIGIDALINIIISLFSIILCWRVLLTVRIEEIMRIKKKVQARALMVLLSIVLGHQLARFIIDYLFWSRMLSGLIS
jgi:uncharacterized integral membrane protein (TIGR02327 family)